MCIADGMLATRAAELAHSSSTASVPPPRPDTVSETEFEVALLRQARCCGGLGRCGQAAAAVAAAMAASAAGRRTSDRRMQLNGRPRAATSQPAAAEPARRPGVMAQRLLL